MALFIGLLVSLAAVALVLDPIIRPSARPSAGPSFEPEEDPLRSQKELALAAIKEIEFDRATGKLSDTDYERLHARYTAEALEALRAEDGAAQQPARGAVADPVEELIQSARQAAARKQRFCCECGAPLEGSGKFCVECGAGQEARAVSREL